MKTEKEFSEFFVESCQFDRQNAAFISDVAKNYWMDLTSHLGTYFSNEDRLQITKTAAQMLSTNLKQATAEQAWSSVIRDFTRKNHWGFANVTRKPKVKRTEEQKIFWHFFKYLWAFIQAMFIIKFAIYYFGIEATRNPDQMSIGWMWLFAGISFSSLVYFAYRNRNDKD